MLTEWPGAAETAPAVVNTWIRGADVAKPTPSYADRFWSHVTKSDGCWTWNGVRTPKGYGRVSGPGRRMRQAHRAAFELAVGPIPDGLFVLHRCDNPPCVRPDHLFVGTARDNSLDAWAKGRAVAPVMFGPRNPMYTHPERRSHGEAHASSVLTATQVETIRLRLQAGESQRSIATDLGVSRSAIWSIKHGRTWRIVA